MVSCEDFSPGSTEAWSVIKVGTKGMGKIIFKPVDIDAQLRRLETILQSIGYEEWRSIDMIDLTLDGRAAVRIADNSRNRTRRGW